ncbi:hypothetical protein VNO78_32835 [Psophocarpus tetragonolobus]|uniref:Uncharacterized protein n=1 Tax=Psophocarpus tetragonolobus TaxID=3891 RepID=A0AAN9RQA9_PSOTE
MDSCFAISDEENNCFSGSLKKKEDIRGDVRKEERQECYVCHKEVIYKRGSSGWKSPNSRRNLPPGSFVCRIKGTEANGKEKRNREIMNRSNYTLSMCRELAFA